MNLCLIIAAVISGCLGAVKIKVDVHGNLTCPEPFYYIVSLWEEDNFKPDFINSYTDFASTGKTSYQIIGEAFDNWLETHVEPYFIVEHTCVEDSKFECLCVKFDPKNVDFAVKVNIDFKSTNLTRCEECDAAAKRRARAAAYYRPK